MQQLYNKAIDYINAQNQDQLLSNQIQNLKQTVTNNKTQSDQSFKDVNNQALLLSTNLSQLQANQSNYLLITPTDTINLNANYLIDISQINNLINLQIKLRQINDLNQLVIKQNQISDISLYALKSDIQSIDLTNYYNKQQVDQKISSIKIDPVDLSNYLKIPYFNIQIVSYLKIQDFNDQIKNYLLINDYINDKKNFVNQDYLQQYCKQNYLNINIDKVTLLNSNYNIFTSQIQDLQTYMNNYVLQSSLDQIINTKLQQYLLINPQNTNTFLNINYKIVKEQITNLDTTDLANFYNKQQVDQLISQIQANPVDLINYYNKQQVDQKIAQIQNNPTDLTKYLLIEDYENQIKDYLLVKEYYTDRKRFITIDYIQYLYDQYYLAKFIDQTTLLDPNYSIITSQIQDLNNYMGSNYYNKQQVDQQIQNNKQTVDLSNYYDSKTIDDKLTQYMLSSPQKFGTQLDLFYQVLVGQIKDFYIQLEFYLGSHNYVNQHNIDIYFKDYVKQKDLTNYLSTTDLNKQLLNYVLISDFIIQLQKYAQIVDLQKYVLTNDLNKKLQNYVLSSNLTTNLQTNYYTQQQVNDLFNNFLRLDDYNLFSQDYVKKYDYNQFVKNCLVAVPNIPVQLNQNYSISSFQISDLYTNFYNRQEINGLMNKFNDYLRIIPNPSTYLNLNYQVSTSQIWDLQKLLSNYVLQNDLLISLSQYLPLNPALKTALNSNYTIKQSKITDLSPADMSNYLLINPSLKTALNTNYTIKQSQITDLSPADMSNYLPINPTSQITLNSKYTISGSQISNNIITASQIANHTINSLQIAANTITKSEIAQNTIVLQNLYQDLVNLILQQKIYVKYITESAKILQIDQTGSVCQFGQQLTMENKTQIATVQCYTGFGGYMFTGNSNVNNVNWQQSPSSSIQLDTSKQLNDSGCYGMHFNNLYYNQPSFIGFCGLQPWIIRGNYNCCFFSMNTSPSVYSAYISSDGTYFRNSDENKKQNIQKKQNYQDQLDNILKLDIVTYSYDLNYSEKIQELEKNLKDETLTEERKKQIQNDIFQIQVQQSQVQQGFTYRNLQDCGFKYVLNNKQVMNDQFLDQKGFDKDKIKKEIANNQQLTISESNFIPYLIMGIKALNENITNQDTKYQQIILDQQNQIEKINERIDIINDAMIQSLSKIDEVSQQTVQKINDVQQNSLLHSINSDNIDDIKNNLNKLIYSFDNQQQTIKKLQNSINFLVSQNEQQQHTIEKQQQDIINLKLKTKLV